MKLKNIIAVLMLVVTIVGGAYLSILFGGGG